MILVPVLTGAACFGAFKAFKEESSGSVVLGLATVLLTSWVLASGWVTIDVAIRTPEILSRIQAAKPSK